MNLKDSLASHLRSAGWLAYKEMPLGSVSRNGRVQRADVLALKKSYTARIVVYETKVSRGDFTRDIGEGKYEGYLPMCHQLYFAVLSGLVKKQEVPEGCGLIVYSEGSGWHTVHGARVRQLDLSEPKFFELLLACLFRGWEEERGVRRLRERIDLTDNVELSAQAKHIGWLIASRLRTVEPELRMINEARQLIDEFVGEKSSDLRGAFSKLRRQVEIKFPGMALMDTSLELVEIACNLVTAPFGTLFRDGAKQRLFDIAERLRDGGSGVDMEGGLDVHYK